MVASLTSFAQRAAVLHVAAYLSLFPLGLHRYRAYSQSPAILSSIAWPFLALSSSIIFNVVQFNGSLDFSVSTAVYSAANAGIIALVAAFGWQNSDSSTFRVVLLVVFAVNAAYQLVPATVGGVSLDLEPGPGADYDSLEPLEPSSSIKSPSTRLPTPPLRAIALAPALLALVDASCLALAPSPTLDIVVAHHSHAPADVAHHIAAVRLVPLARKSRVRVYLYEKGDWTDQELWRGLSGAMDPKKDELVRLPNVGREGGTYLEHVVRHYNATVTSAGARGGSAWVPRLGLGGKASVRPLADTTLFLQEHLAWDWIAAPRLRRTLSTRTAFVSLGPYQTNLCGLDSEVHTQMGGIADIFEMVKGRPCTDGNEEDRVLSTWAGQFAASRRTLLKNELGVYERLVRKIEVRSPSLPLSLSLSLSGAFPYLTDSCTLQAPDDDPIHKQYNPSGPSTSSCVPLPLSSAPPSRSALTDFLLPIPPPLIFDLVASPSSHRARSNPAFGHALERSWPLLLHCDDKRIAETCRDGAWEPRDCQCDD